MRTAESRRAKKQAVQQAAAITSSGLNAVQQHSAATYARAASQAAQKETFVPAFEIKVNGSPLPVTVKQAIQEVTVTHNQDPPGQFQIKLAITDALHSASAPQPFAEGGRIEIAMGYQNRTQPLFVGEVIALSMDFPTAGEETLTVEGFDLSHRLTRGTAYRIFGGVPGPDDALKDSDIVMQLAKDVGLSARVDPTPQRTNARIQRHTTNRKLLDAILEDNEFHLWMEGDTLHFQRQPPDGNTVSLEWHKDLLSFSPRLTTAGMVNEVNVYGWDPQEKQSFVANAQRSGSIDRVLSPTGIQMVQRGAAGNSMRTLIDTNAASRQEAETLARGVMKAQAQEFLTATGSAVGNPDIRLGTKLHLLKVARFSLTYTVTKATHVWGGEGYVTRFEVCYAG